MTSPLSGLSLYEQLGHVMRSEHVRSKLREVANRLEQRAQALANGEAPVTREDGTRPGTNARDHAERPYSRVSVTTEFEFGGPNQTRMRVLGRAIEEL